MQSDEVFCSVTEYLVILIYICDIAGSLQLTVIFDLQVTKGKSCESPNTFLIRTLANADLGFSALVFANIIILRNQSSFPLFNIFMHEYSGFNLHLRFSGCGRLLCNFEAVRSHEKSDDVASQ